MSSRLLSNKVISQIVEAIAFSNTAESRDSAFPHIPYAETPAPMLTFYPVTPERKSALGKKIFNLNLDALVARYGENHGWEGEKFVFDPLQPFPRPVQAFKDISSLLYQLREGDVPNRRLYRQLLSYHYELAKKIVQATPEYDLTAWA